MVSCSTGIVLLGTLFIVFVLLQGRNGRRATLPGFGRDKRLPLPPAVKALIGLAVTVLMFICMVPCAIFMKLFFAVYQ